MKLGAPTAWPECTTAAGYDRSKQTLQLNSRHGTSINIESVIGWRAGSRRNKTDIRLSLILRFEEEAYYVLYVYMGPEYYFNRDNTPFHLVSVTQEWFNTLGTWDIKWPTCSPDPSPV